MDELCVNMGGYGGFFWMLIRHHFAWWLLIIVVPALFLDHHRCEARLPFFAWLVYGATLVAMLTVSLLLELSVVQRLGLLRGGDLQEIWLERRWQLMVAATLLWKLDSYTDIAFMFVARDCGSSLWWASLATFGFVVIFGQLFLSTSCSCRDCERELPPSFGFVLLDFKLVNHAVKQVLPFDPDASDLPVARPVTLRTVAHLLSLLKIMGDVAQVSIQLIYYKNAEAPQAFVVLSILASVLHGTLACGTLVQEWLQDELATQSSGLQTGTALRPMSPLPSTPLMRDDVLQVQMQGASIKGRGQAASGAARQASLHGATDPAPRNGAAGSRRRRSPSPPAEMSLLEDQDGEPMADLLL